jgi:peptidoglycan/xylan/chitin deacetylase (PgdA/CDA1 family)
MIDLFRKHQVPLHMAVTPAWLTHSRWKTLKKWTGGDDLFCWHQHGWRHVNHQESGKKGEFGTDRTKIEKKADLTKGRAKLKSIMGDDFKLFFTPPWNRFDSETAKALVELGYKAVSRSNGEQKKVPLPSSLPDIFINVDLHTRTEINPAQSWNALLSEFETAIKTGRVGVMLHHQRMNGVAFEFLGEILTRTQAMVLKRF